LSVSFPQTEIDPARPKPSLKLAEPCGCEVKNIYEVMKQKQQILERLKREIEILYAVLPMLEDDEVASVVPSHLRSASPSATRLSGLGAVQ